MESNLTLARSVRRSREPPPSKPPLPESARTCLPDRNIIRMLGPLGPLGLDVIFLCGSACIGWIYSPQDRKLPDRANAPLHPALVRLCTQAIRIAAATIYRGSREHTKHEYTIDHTLSLQLAFCGYDDPSLCTWHFVFHPSCLFVCCFTCSVFFTGS